VFYNRGERLLSREVSLQEIVGFGSSKLPPRFLEPAEAALQLWQHPLASKKPNRRKSLRGSPDDSTNAPCNNQECVRHVLKLTAAVEKSKEALNAVCPSSHYPLFALYSFSIHLVFICYLSYIHLSSILYSSSIHHLFILYVSDWSIHHLVLTLTPCVWLILRFHRRR
jgi:hypothetical protein